MTYLLPKNIKEIEQLTAQYFGVTVAEMHDGTRNQPMTLARQFVCWYLVEQLRTKIYLPKHYFSINSASVLHGCTRIWDIIETDKEFRTNAKTITDKLDELSEITTNFERRIRRSYEHH